MIINLNETNLLNFLFVLTSLKHVFIFQVKHVENGAELSWTLGMAYHMLSSVISL